MRFLAALSAPPRAWGDVMVDIAGKQQSFCSGNYAGYSSQLTELFPYREFLLQSSIRN
jgi:hypothetical protein